jgi:hypothetical protein
VTWQEDLRTLDAELAEKQITPAEYRRRRDNLLASASGGFPPVGHVAPQRPAPPGDQSPPMFDAEATAVMPPWSAVTELPMYQPLGDQQAPAPQYPPRPPVDEEIFSARLTKQRQSRAALLVVVVVVAVLLLAGGWWFGIRPHLQPNAAAGGGTASSSAPPTSTQSTGPQQLSNKDLPLLPGLTSAKSGDYSVQQAQDKGVFDKGTASFLAGEDIRQVAYRNATDGTLIYDVYAFDTDGAQQADKVVKDLTAQLRRNGMAVADSPDNPPSATTLKLLNATLTQYSVLYRSGDSAILATVTKGGKGGEPAVQSGMRDVMARLLARIPAN